MFRRNFLKTLFLLLPILSFVKFNFLLPNSKKIKLKKNRNFIWYLNNED